MCKNVTLVKWVDINYCKAKAKCPFCKHNNFRKFCTDQYGTENRLYRSCPHFIQGENDYYAVFGKKLL